jgi:hypothetical protein
MKAFTGRGNARDKETVRLRKEIACLRETVCSSASLETLNKAIAVFTIGDPR